MSTRLAPSLLFILAFALPAKADTFFVNASTGDDTWDGRCEVWDGGTCGPKATIQAGIDATEDGDTVIVADGLYSDWGHWNLDFGGRAITLRSANGPAGCTIDCDHLTRAVCFQGGETRAALLSGFTFRGGHADSGDAILSYQSSPRIENCVFEYNSSQAHGGAIDCVAAAGNHGGVLSAYTGSHAILSNCTLVSNSAQSFGGATVANCIVRGNTASAGSQIGIGYQSAATVSFCDVQGGADGIYLEPNSTLTWGTGNIDLDPLFVSADDYRLVWPSPCVDTGTNDPQGGLAETDLAGATRALDGDADGAATADMGAYELGPLTLLVSPAPLALFVPLGQTVSSSQPLYIQNGGAGSLAWELTLDSDWLQAAPTSGVVTVEPGEAAVWADATGLPSGTFTASLVITAAGAAGSPHTVPVTLHVGGEIRVPEDYPNIQSAIDAADNGDHVVVADGAWRGAGNNNLDFQGKLLTLRSAHGPQHCIIDCEHYADGVRLYGPTPYPAVVNGLTIQNALNAIVIGDRSPTIRRCILLDSGRGVYAAGPNPLIADCAIRGNGVGIDVRAGAADIVNCLITDNTGSQGSGVHCEQAVSHLINCILWNNFHSSSSRQIELFGSDAEVYVDYCDVQNGVDGVFIPSGQLFWGGRQLRPEPATHVRQSASAAEFALH